MPLDAIPLPPNVQTRPLSKLLPYAQNPKIHSDDQIAAIAGSMQEFGFTNPVLIDPKGEIIAGHGRVLAAVTLGIDDIPVVVLPHLNDAQKRAYRIADNKLAERAEWSPEMLRLEFEALHELKFDLELTGFTIKEIDALLRGDDYSRTGEDDAPEKPKDPVTKPGEIWLLGKHRLLCGDATSADDVGKLLGKDKPQLMVTDPPYGVEYDPKWRDDLGIDWTGKAQRRSTHPNAKPLKSRSLGKVLNDDNADWTPAWNAFPGHIAYVWHGGLHAAVVAESLNKAGLDIRAQIIWVKQHFVFSRGDYHWQHEPCWYAVRKTGAWTGDRKQTTVWNIANASAFKGEKDDTKTDHGTQKPVEAMRRPILNHTRKGGLCYDPFVGSGTTIIAAETCGRRCLAIDIDPGYCDVTIERWEDMTGGKAKLA